MDHPPKQTTANKQPHLAPARQAQAALVPEALAPAVPASAALPALEPANWNGWHASLAGILVAVGATFLLVNYYYTNLLVAPRTPAVLLPPTVLHAPSHCLACSRSLLLPPPPPSLLAHGITHHIAPCLALPLLAPPRPASRPASRKII